MHTTTRRAAALVLAATAVTSAAHAQESGLVTVASPHPVRATLDRFAQAVRAAGWVVFTEIDHQAAAAAAGMTLAPRTVIVFGNPRAGTAAMAAHPMLAIDLPMRALVWQDEQGRVFVTRSTGAGLSRHVFARHGIPLDDAQQRGMEAVLDGFVRAATQ
jgi:uncharacterized protein (DUF302 family)